MNTSRKRQLTGLAGWLLVSFVAGGFGAAASIHAREFYGQLVRPPWAPPGSVFGPVWSVLYTLMGVAAWLVWRKAGWTAAKPALILFVAQLALNALWSWLFFAWHLGAWAFADVLTLWVLIACTLVQFWRRSVAGGALLTPYLAWVTFAAMLCHATWRLNPGRL